FQHTPSLSSLFHSPAPIHTYTLSLHDALPIFRFQEISIREQLCQHVAFAEAPDRTMVVDDRNLGHTGLVHLCQRVSDSFAWHSRSEEHTSELQSRENLVCRLLLEKKKSPLPSA